MNGLRTGRRANGDAGVSRLSWLIILWLVLGCLTVQRTGVNVLIGTFVRLGQEESTEESKCEDEVREVSHKCSRVRIARHGREGHYQSAVALAISVIQAPGPSVQVAVHLVGSGIKILC